MTAQPRTAGRPIRDEEIGRTVILEKTRLAMRERPRADLQRNEIARYAGVTPALISYYFPDRSNLFEAAAHPVIESYVEGVRSIIGSNLPMIDRLNDLIFLFVKFNYQEGHLLDFYLEHIERTGGKKNMQLLEEIYREMLTFFEELLRTKTIRGGSAVDIQSMLWGMCKHTARRPAFKVAGDAAGLDDQVRSKAVLLSDYFLHGAVGSPLERDRTTTSA